MRRNRTMLIICTSLVGQEPKWSYTSSVMKLPSCSVYSSSISRTNSSMFSETVLFRVEFHLKNMSSFWLTLLDSIAIWAITIVLAMGNSFLNSAKTALSKFWDPILSMLQKRRVRTTSIRNWLMCYTPALIENYIRLTLPTPKSTSLKKEEWLATFQGTWLKLTFSSAKSSWKASIWILWTLEPSKWLKTTI